MGPRRMTLQRRRLVHVRLYSSLGNTGDLKLVENFLATDDRDLGVFAGEKPWLNADRKKRRGPFRPRQSGQRRGPYNRTRI